MNSKKIWDYASKKVKDSIMSDSNSDRGKHADTIIRNHVIWSMGAGFIPVVVADVLAISALQLDMIRQMCKVYDVDFSETQGKAVVTALTSSTLARIGAGSVVKLIPVLGSIAGGAALSVLAGGSTYAIGQIFKRHFESGGTILDFDPARLKKMYQEQFEKGKKMAEQWRKDEKVREEANQAAQENDAPYAQPEPQPAKDAAPQPASFKKPQSSASTDAIARLKELAQLRDSGVISEEEFQTMKRKVIEGF
ncbi:MAG: DUF697 domain-containing protein [Bacteroidetes bacterium]|jgi:uncharacterized protein (DUF697 family)|nr:DUF697 domain-containing protein [Bacteroidota bacterium]